MTRAAPKDEGQEGRRLVAAAHVADPTAADAVAFVVRALAKNDALNLGIRLEVVAAIVERWPEIDRMYAAKVIRDLCRGTCAVSDGWRGRLEALAGCGEAVDNSGGAE